MESIGERIKFWRERRKLSQVLLAQQAGISRNHLWRIEKGDRPKVGADVLARIAEALGVSVDDLVGEGQPAQKPSPEALELAEKIDLLPADVRGLLTGIVNSFLKQLDRAALSDQQLHLVEEFDDLPAESQQRMLAAVQNIRAVREAAHAAESADARGSEAP